MYACNPWNWVRIFRGGVRTQQCNRPSPQSTPPYNSRIDSRECHSQQRRTGQRAYYLPPYLDRSESRNTKRELRFRASLDEHDTELSLTVA
jgi:hypothetical protein